MHFYQRGVTLPITMLLLLAALTIGASAAQMAMLGEKAARAERDRLIAFLSAEVALRDAQHYIKAGLGPPVDATPDAPAAPAWQVVELAGNGGTEYGALTGASMETGRGVLPFRRPRYLVERVAYTPAGAPPAYYYRVTVIGFGPREGAETVLQASYTPPVPVHRHSWREIMDWQALHAAAIREDDQ